MKYIWEDKDIKEGMLLTVEDNINITTIYIVGYSYNKSKKIWHFVSLADGLTNTFDDKQMLIDFINKNEKHISCNKEVLFKEL